MDRLFGFDKPLPPPLEGLALLSTVYDDVLAEIYESQLSEAGIPCVKKDRGSGGAMRVIMGSSCFGTDIFVPEEKLEEAKELLQSLPVEEEADGEDVPTAEEEK